MLRRRGFALVPERAKFIPCALVHVKAANRAGNGGWGIMRFEVRRSAGRGTRRRIGGGAGSRNSGLVIIFHFIAIGDDGGAGLARVVDGRRGRSTRGRVVVGKSLPILAGMHEVAVISGTELGRVGRGGGFKTEASRRIGKALRYKLLGRKGCRGGASRAAVATITRTTITAWNRTVQTRLRVITAFVRAGFR